MKKLYDVMDKQVANLSVFFTKLHHYHWFVKGPSFFTLHEKFEAFYDEVNELYDEVAERLLTIGGTPSSTLKAYLAKTSLAEETKIDSAANMVKQVVNDMKLLVIEFKEAIVIAQEFNDEATADLFIGAVSSFEKHIWMLEFTLA
jgi:starvation-inducible DNA-binding protein